MDSGMAASMTMSGPLFSPDTPQPRRILLSSATWTSHLHVAAARDAQRFISVLLSRGLQQHVHELSHVHGHTLGVVINMDTSSLVSDIAVTDPGHCYRTDRLTRDCFAVSFTINIARPAPCWKTSIFLLLPCYTHLAAPWMYWWMPTVMD